MPFLLWALVSVFISWTLRVRASLFLYSQRQTLCRKKKVLNNCKLNLIKWFLSPHQLGQSTEIQNQQVLGLLGNKPLTGTVMGIWHKHLFQSPGESGGIAICCFTMWHRISGEKQLQEGRWGEDGSYSFIHSTNTYWASTVCPTQFKVLGTERWKKPQSFLP